MESVSIGELQKNISLLTQLTEVINIVDKRKNKTVATVYPTQKSSIVASMAGKYRDRVVPVDDLSRARSSAMLDAMGEKYGLSS